MKKKKIRKRLEAQFAKLKDGSVASYQEMYRVMQEIGDQIGHENLDFFAQHAKGGLNKKKIVNLLYAAQNNRSLDKAVELDPSAKLAYQIINLRESKGWTRETLSHTAGVPLDELTALENAQAEAINLTNLQKLSNTLGAKLKLSFKPNK